MNYLTRALTRAATDAFNVRAGLVALLVLTMDEGLKDGRTCPHRALPPVVSFCDRLEVIGPLRLLRTGNAGSALGFGQGWWVWLMLAVLGVLLIPLYARWLADG